MRTALAALLACLFVVIITADRVVCPDGCTDDAAAQPSSQHVTSSCAICHGWSHTPVVLVSRPAPRVVARDTAVVTDPTDPALPTPERPPKAA